MKAIPFYSIIIPTYNRAAKLKKTIQSVLSQTFADFELLIMDDGSTDNTREVVESFTDSRIYYEWDINSGGPATPRNRGIEIARGEWICFLDADDIWYSNKLETVFAAIQQDHDAAVFCHNEICRMLSKGKTKLLRHGPYEDDFYRKMLVYGNRVSTSAVTVRKEFLNRYGLRFNQSKDYVALEDYDLWLRIALHGGRFYFCDQPLGEYVIENDNISSNKYSVKHNKEVILRDHVFKIQMFEPEKEKLWRLIETNIAVEEANAHMLCGELKPAVIHLIRAIFSEPSHTIRFVIKKASLKYKNSMHCFFLCSLN